MANAEMDLPTTISSIDELGRMIVEGTETRESQAAQFVKDDAKHKQAMEAIDEAIMLITNLNAGVSFLQVRTRINDVTDKLKSMVHLTDFSMYAPMIEALISVSQSTEPSAIVRILNLLQKLRDSIKATNEQETALESERANNWAKTFEDLSN